MLSGPTIILGSCFSAMQSQNHSFFSGSWFLPGPFPFPGGDVWRPFLISGCGGGLLLVLAEPFVEWSLLRV